MALLEDGRVIADPWTHVADDAPLPDGPAIMSVARLLQGVTNHGMPLGVALPNDADTALLAPLLDRLALVVLHFPKHRDGRAFSQARALRERYGFAGTIRASGHVLPDLHLFLLRCGVTSVEVPEGTDSTVWEQARRVIATAYQPAVTGDVPLGLLRQRIALR